MLLHACGTVPSKAVSTGAASTPVGLLAGKYSLWRESGAIWAASLRELVNDGHCFDGNIERMHAARKCLLARTAAASFQNWLSCKRNCAEWFQVGHIHHIG